MTGLIAKIQLKNFMCHDMWEMVFDKDILFIGGENGAGKSAILAALCLCFGGNARSTNRGSAIGSFVQRGKHQAHIAITIRNTGPEAFHHDLYGDTLTIERTINEKGACPFKIKDHNGTFLSLADFVYLFYFIFVDL
jgi:chromosome segregation ATPase